mgnify:CR=1 FL=1
MLLYVFISQLSGLHWLATLLTGIISNVPGTVTYFKLEMRGEPFLPWDITQVGDFAGVAGKVELDIQPTMLWTLAIFLVLLAASCFLRMPYRKETRWRWRIGSAAVSGFLWCLLVFGVYLNAPCVNFSAFIPICGCRTVITKTTAHHGVHDESAGAGHRSAGELL